MSLNYLINDINEVDDTYKDYFIEYKDTRLAFLNYLKYEVGITGIALYEIDLNNSSIKKLELNQNGTEIEETDCP